MASLFAKLENLLTEELKQSQPHLYALSRFELDSSALGLGRENGEKLLFEIADSAELLESSLVGDVTSGADYAVKRCPLTHENAVALRTLLPWTAPVSLRNRKTTIGCGDRLGRATPGHLQAVKQYPVAPVLAQQSIRELNLTGRTFENVVDDVTFLVLQEGYTDGYGADGDHLKTLEDINMAIDAGMAMITLDLSEVMNAQAQAWSAEEVEQAFSELQNEDQQRVLDLYADAAFELDGQTVELTELEAKRCAVMYLEAMDFAAEVYQLLVKRRGNAFDLEISIDETEAPTLPGHHLFIIRELLQRKVEIASLAPRFIGEFQKAIDYIGDLKEFERQFAVHCAIAKAYGDYKVSIHSGSDKFSVYPPIGRYTELRVHVKTAGTSWLEAVRTVAECDPQLYRDVHKKAVADFPKALQFYHVTPDLDAVPDLDSVEDADLPDYMDDDNARQLLHVTYGFILGDATLKSRFFEVLDRHEDVYCKNLKRHFEHHLDELGVPKQ